MTDKQEKLSALMDGEYDRSDMFDALKNSAELRDQWNRYHLIRSTMRQEMSSGPIVDISARVADALANEPVVLAPKSKLASIPFIGKLSSKVVPFAKQSGQFAVAASVAAAVIVGVQTFNQPADTEPFMTAPPAAGPQGGLAPVSLEQTRVLPSEQRPDVLEARRHVNALIADHEQQVKLKASEKTAGEQEQDDKPAH